MSSIKINDIALHTFSGKTFEIYKIVNDFCMGYEIDKNLEKIPRLNKMGQVETNIDCSVSYKVSLLRLKNLTNKRSG